MASTGLGQHGSVAKDVIVTALSCLIFLSQRIWLCHLCKSPSGGHRIPQGHPWAFPWPCNFRCHCPVLWALNHLCDPELGSLQDHSWAGGQKPVEVNLPLLSFTSTKWRWAVTIDPSLRPQFPKFLFRKPRVHFALFAYYLPLNIHHCPRSSPAGLLLSQSPPNG